MSFFGFNTDLPRDRPAGQGMFERHDPFGGLSRDGGDDDDVLNFEDTYDGLGNHLKESGDTFNDDTFGGVAPVTRQGVGRDFDFAGQTANVRDELLEEQALHQARQPGQWGQQPQYQQPAAHYGQPSRPKRTGYEAYKEPEYIPKLEADASIWGKPMGRKPAEPQQQAKHDASAGRKFLSLEEVEAGIHAQPRPTPSPAPDMDTQSQGLRAMLGVGGPPPQQDQEQQQRPMRILQRPQQPLQEPPQAPRQMPDTRGPPMQQQRQQPPPQMQQQRHPRQQQMQGQPQLGGPPQQQMPGQMGGAAPVQPPHARGPPQPAGHARGPSYNGPPIMQAQQVMHMTEEERQAYIAEDAKRAKRNHKIQMLSVNNGLMTPQDKNFITRIQLQQLLTATGGLDNDAGGEDQLAEDFYYQVHSQIRGPPRSGPGQPLSQFAQTYLFQTGSRYGYGRNRNHPRGGDNHVQRMEQQVARAVEAAKARPKNKSLVVEGSLGKIAFSNSKTPRPLLNLKRQDSEQRVKTATKHITNRKAVLRDIEKVYSVLMKLEDHERKLPPPPNEDSPADVIEAHIKWRTEMQGLNQQLWESLKVMEPIQQDPTTPHPFIAILSHSKAKKAFPRLFRHLDEQQRLTALTLLSIHLDSLNVIRDAHPTADSTPLPPKVRDEIDLFGAAVMPPLFAYVNEAPLGIVLGLLGLVLDRVHVQAVVRTKVGVSLLTMLVSRAELAAQAPGAAAADDRQHWLGLYARLFDLLEPVLPFLFPTDTSVSAADDVHVWQFLATVGVGASPDQQQRLVLGVKERVMETVAVSRALPEEMRERRLGEVNLFMRAIGLDVELLG